MKMNEHAVALAFCLTLPGLVVAAAQNDGLTVVDESSGRVSCSTSVTADATTYHLAPGEERRIALKASFTIGQSDPSAARREATPVEADWRLTPAPGRATPEAQRVGLQASATPAGAGSEPYVLAGSLESIYAAPSSAGLYGLPLRVVLDSEQAQAAGIPERCRVATAELAMLVGPGDGEAQYLFSLSGFYAGAGLARAGAVNRGTFRVGEAGKVHGNGTLDLWLDGKCFRSRERQALRIEGWQESGRIHLRLHESGPREKIDDWTSPELSCLLTALAETGSLLTQAVADLAMGEVTFKAVEPGEEYRFSPDNNWSASIRGLRR